MKIVNTHVFVFIHSIPQIEHSTLILTDLAITVRLSRPLGSEFLSYFKLTSNLRLDLRLVDQHAPATCVVAHGSALLADIV